MSTIRATTLSLESIGKFHDWLCGKGRSNNTASAYATDLRMLLLDRGVRAVTMEDFEDVATHWLTSTRRIVALKTTSRRLTSVRAFAKWAGWPAALTEYSAPHAAPTVPHPLPEGMAGVRKMLGYARTPQQRALVALCGFLGLRVGEALAVKPSDFDMTDMELKVLGKGEKYRYVPVSPEAWGALAEPVTMAFLANDGFVVPIADRVARSNITQMGKRAGLKRSVASHDLRATFATAVYDRTKDMRLVQELLGHASVETTQIYVGVQRAKLHSAVEL